MVTHGDFVAISPYRKFSADNAWNPCFSSAAAGSKEGLVMGTIFIVIVVVLVLAVIGFVSLFRRRGH